MQHRSQSGGQIALNGVVPEQEDRRGSVGGRKVKTCTPRTGRVSPVGTATTETPATHLDEVRGVFAHMQLVEEHRVGVPSRLRRFPELLLGRVAVHGTQSEQAVCTQAHTHTQML